MHGSCCQITALPRVQQLTLPLVVIAGKKGPKDRKKNATKKRTRPPLSDRRFSELTRQKIFSTRLFSHDTLFQLRTHTTPHTTPTHTQQSPSTATCDQHTYIVRTRRCELRKGPKQQRDENPDETRDTPPVHLSGSPHIRALNRADRTSL